MLGERLQGFLLVLLGCATMVLIYLAQQGGWFGPRPPLPTGPGGVSLPTVSPLACLVPIIGVGALGLCLIGMKMLLWPDDWNPPKHLG
jgi:hypothetical protein